MAEPTTTSNEGKELLQPDVSGKVVKSEASDAAGAVPAPLVGAEGGEPTPPTTPEPRVYSEEEWDKRQSSIDKQVADIRKQHDEALVQSRKQYDETLAQLEARQDAEFLSKVEEGGGDVDAAKRILARDQAARKRERDIEGRENTMKSQILQLGEVAKQNDANRLAKEYGVDADELLKANDPAEMERIALKLALEASKVEAKKPVKTDTNVPSAKGVDWSKLSPSQKVLEGIKDMNL